MCTYATIVAFLLVKKTHCILVVDSVRLSCDKKHSNIFHFIFITIPEIHLGHNRLYSREPRKEKKHSQNYNYSITVQV